MNQRGRVKLVAIISFLLIGCTQTAELSNDVPVIPERSVERSASQQGDPQQDPVSQSDAASTAQPTEVMPVPSEPAQPSTTAPEPSQESTDAARAPSCSDATEIRTGWIESANEQIARQGARFPDELWICDDDPTALTELDCMPLRTERMFTMLIEIFGDQARALAEADAVFCIAGDPALLASSGT